VGVGSVLSDAEEGSTVSRKFGYYPGTRKVAGVGSNDVLVAFEEVSSPKLLKERNSPHAPILMCNVNYRGGEMEERMTPRNPSIRPAS